jgi:hypothetical protein
MKYRAPLKRREDKRINEAVSPAVGEHRRRPHLKVKKRQPRALSHWMKRKVQGEMPGPVRVSRETSQK